MIRFLIPGVLALFVSASLATGSDAFARNNPVLLERMADNADANSNSMLAELSQLQVSFHRAATIHNPDGLDTGAALEQRIADMLSLWADDGSLTLKTVSPSRTFIGKGEAGTASCAPGSNTVCDFFATVAPPFQPGKRLVSLGPTFKTQLAPDGDTATVYFECHYFDADTWRDISHVSMDATAKNADGRWLFAHGDVSPVGIPYP